MGYGIVRVGVVALVALGVGGSGLLAAVGCSDTAVANGAKSAAEARSTVIVHEPCEESSGQVAAFDVNNDGKPDIKKVSKGGKEICRITDLNHDGKPDMFEYFDGNGQLRRRESDYDDNNVVNAIETFENGKIVRRELDTSNQGRIDTWDFFDPSTGNRLRRERDANGDGKVDQWWTYEGGQVTIAMDSNGDGLPDPESTITLGANGQVVTDASAPVVATDAAPAPSASPAPTPSALAIPSASGSGDLAPGTAPTTDAGIAGKPQRGGAKR